MPPKATSRILMFHRVLDDCSAAFDIPCSYRIRGTALTVGEFTRVLDAAGPILPLDEIEHALASSSELPIGTVLTFDDGYREHLEVVAKILASRSMPATFYIATGLNGTCRVAVVDAWYWLLDHATERMARVVMPDGSAYEGRIDSLEGKTAWVNGRPKAALLAATVSQQAEMIADLSRSVGCELPASLAAQLYMTEADWSRLVDLRMRVGAHSVSHPILTLLEDNRLRMEVQTSIQIVRRLSDPVTFAYPNGNYDRRVEFWLGQAGAVSAVTCESGVVRRDTNRLRLPRLSVRPDVDGFSNFASNT